MKVTQTLKRSVCGLSLLVLCLYTTLLPFMSAGAASFPGRSLSISTSVASVSAVHSFGFTYSQLGSVGSLVFEYCDSPVSTLACLSVPGIDSSSAILTSQSGVGGFSIFSQSSNQIIIARPSSANSLIASTYTFSGVINPLSSKQDFYVRIHARASSNGTGVDIEKGSVVSHTTASVQLTTEVPPLLRFCVATVIGTDCSTAAGSFLQLGNLSSATAASSQSQMLAQTNADFGYVISVSGTTMTSGNNIVAPLTSPTVSIPGTQQFGINLRANSQPVVGQEPIGVGIATPSAQYALVNQYKFNNGDTIASANDVSDYVKFTVSYLVNVANNQKPGVYSTTLTYVISATF